MSLDCSLAPFGQVTARQVLQAADQHGTPVYLYDERQIVDQCRSVLSMPNAYGLEARFAMKANSGRAILQLVAGQGLNIDASSLNEAKRAQAAGIALARIMLTTQEVPAGADRADLETMLLGGLRYNVCSLRQLELVADFAAAHRLPLSLRVHPGVGSGESATRNTGDKYSCFGVHLSDLPQALALAAAKGVFFEQVHAHIGSGGDPEAWRANIDRELGFVEQFFPAATRVSFGGGFKVARMPDEKAADVADLGGYAKRRFEAFHARTGRKLVMEVEPGTYIVANAGYLVTRVIDRKHTGEGGFDFILVDGGMEVNTRPLLYGSRHPFYLLAANGKLLSSDYQPSIGHALAERIVAGRCCESGDSQTLDDGGHIVPRRMGDPQAGDLLVIGGAGAYCSSMSPFNYNSHLQAPELLVRGDGTLQLVRRREAVAEIWRNELPLA